VMGVLYLAKKYMVSTLVERCTEYLIDHLDPSDVFNILPAAEKYEEKNLVDRCWKVIDEQTEATVKSDGFATIDRSLLEQLVVRDTLSITEVDLFQAVDVWAATKQCKKQGLAVNGELKRRIIGEEIIKAIRFPLMRQVEFEDVVLDAKILTPDEIVMVFKFFNLRLTSPVGIPDTRRSGSILRCRRFQSVLLGSWGYGIGYKDYLVFFVDKDISLHGLSLFGTDNNTYTVDLQVKDTNNNSAVVSKTGTFLSKRLQYEDSCYYGYEVLFDSAAELKKNTKYQIEALISGPRSGWGDRGFKTTLQSGVTFTFSNSDSRNSNFTDQTTGQFPEFLFSVS